MRRNREVRSVRSSHDSSVPEAPGSTAREPAGLPVELAQRLGLFDATMLVMGGIVGTGIFVVPQLVAERVHTPLLNLGVWLLGGMVAVCGGLVYAELAARYPEVGGQYVYLREAYHPVVAFLFGWGLLLVMQSGAIASVAIIFSRYFLTYSHISLSVGFVSSVAIGILTLVNCLGVRTGSTVQDAFMVSKILVIGILVACGLLLSHPHTEAWTRVFDRPVSTSLLSALGTAMVPVLFTYSGWQAAGFVSSEVRNPRRNIPLATVLGVTGVIFCYGLVAFVDIWVLGPAGLARANVPASAVMMVVLGIPGAKVMALGIMIAALGYISQAALTAPRVYYAMAQDGVFFKDLAWLPVRTRVPVLAVSLQGVFAIAIALSGTYDQVLNYVMSAEFIFFCLTGASIFIFRHRSARPRGHLRTAEDGARKEMPGHPWTTCIFTLASALISINMVYTRPLNSLIGIGIVLAGVPVYFLWRQDPQQKKSPPPRTVPPA